MSPQNSTIVIKFAVFRTTGTTVYTNQADIGVEKHITNSLSNVQFGPD